MKITYTSPNRSHHYPYAQALHRAGALHAFVSGFSRLSPRAKAIEVGDKLHRHDFFQTQYLASLKLGLPPAFSTLLNRLSGWRLDQASYELARQSDVFLFYRTQGLRTTRRLHQQRSRTICVMEEVNSHVEYARTILHAEYQRLGLPQPFEEEPDYALRLQTYAEADYILCPSEFVRQSFLRKGFAPERILKVVFGLPPIELAGPGKVYQPGDVFRVLYVGQLHYRKGLHYAIEAFSRLRHPRKEFIIVGPKTPITGLEKTIIPEGVTFTGALKGEELEAQYRQASCFMLPSLEEGLALVQIEALSFGLPLLITTNTGGEDLITDGVQGFIVPPGNAAALEQRLQQMADSPELLTRMSKAAAQTTQQLDDWDAAAGRLTQLFTELLAAKESLPV